MANDPDVPMTRRARKESERAAERAQIVASATGFIPVIPEIEPEPVASLPQADVASEIMSESGPRSAWLAEPGDSASPAAEASLTRSSWEEALEPEPPFRSGRNLPAAIGVAAVLIVLVGAGLFLPFGSPAQPWGFVALIAIASGVALWEFSAAVRTQNIEIALPPLLVGGVGIVISAYNAGIEALLVAFVLTAGAAFIWRILDGGGATALRDASVSILAAAYIPFLAGFVAVMLAQTNGPWRVAVFIALAVASDTGGFVAGVLFGRHPMSPTVSPSKTWEGFAGSTFLTVAVALPATYFLLEGTLLMGAVLGVLAVCAATMGDLIESVIKRDLEVKDMSSLLPGHGGILDRVDSILVAAPVIFTAMWLILGV